MSPKARCPECGKKRVFHSEEMKAVNKGKVVCLECGLEATYYEFLAEVLDGEHPELIEKLKKQLEEEEGDTVL